MHNLHWVDYLIVFGPIIFTILVGLYFAKRHKSSDKFFSGGRNLPSWAIGFSTMTTLISSATSLAYSLKRSRRTKILPCTDFWEKRRTAISTH
ncbi:MAG: hypothetical protein LBO71_09555 [Prevotellaceae bacterium]|nr:hypothetical protein [Prevotellaceae bacterium]